MDKGLIIIGIVGAVFIYFAVQMFNTSSSADDSKWASSTNKAYEAYYKKGITGDKVLDLNSYDIAKARTIWPTTPTAKELSEYIPDFEMIDKKINYMLEDGSFKNYLKSYIKKLDDMYVTAEIDTDQAKKLFMELKELK